MTVGAYKTNEFPAFFTESSGCEVSMLFLQVILVTSNHFSNLVNDDLLFLSGHFHPYVSLILHNKLHH